MKSTSLLQLVDKLPQVDKIGNLQQAFGVFRCVVLGRSDCKTSSLLVLRYEVSDHLFREIGSREMWNTC